MGERIQQAAELMPSARRLAFRELGLALGLHGDAFLPQLREHAPLPRAIEGFWLDLLNQVSPAWTGHRDINEVVLATSLVPEGVLRLERLTAVER